MARKTGVTPMSAAEIADVQRQVQQEIARFLDETGTATPNRRAPRSGSGAEPGHGGTPDAGRTGGRDGKRKAKKDPERFTNSVKATVHRNRAQLRPHLVACGVLAAGIVAYACHQAAMPDVPLVVAGAALVGPAAFYAVFARTRVPARRKAWAAACWLSAAAWLTVASAWMSWPVVAAWAVAHVALSARWWREHRDAYPDLDGSPIAEDGGPQTIPELWTANIGCQGGALEGSKLILIEVTDRTEVYVVQLRPGRQTLSTAMGCLDKIASGLHRPMRNLVLEEIPETGDTDDEGDPSQLRLTVVTKSPIKGNLILTEPNYRAAGGREVA